MKIPEIKALIFMKYFSERVPNKNIKSFCNKPLFHWILKRLEASKYINEIIINTDSEIIAEEATKNFKVTIHMRPEYLLAIESNEANQIIEYDLSVSDGEYFLQTHCTNPLLKTETIDNAIEEFFSKNSRKNNDSLISVSAVKKRLYWENGKAINHTPDLLIKTQNLPTVYEENSCIYIFSKQTFLQRKNRIGYNPLFYMMDPRESIDIDDEVDFILAESMMNIFLKMN